MQTKTRFLLKAVLVATVMSAAPQAHASLFGCDANCKARKAQKQQEKALKEEAKRQEKALKEAAKRQRELEKEMARHPERYPRPAPQPVPQLQTAPVAQPQPLPQPTFQPPQVSQPAPITNSPAPVVTQTGLPPGTPPLQKGEVYDPVTGTVMKVAAFRLLEFRRQPKPNMPVIITQPEWTPEIEAQYSRFVAQFGRGVRQAGSRTLKGHMRDPNVNMYANTDTPDIVYYSDCADLPYFLRSYFAFKNGLPMSVASNPVVSQIPYASPADKDEKLAENNAASSPYGNILQSRAASNIAAAPGREINFLTYWSRLMDQISTRTLRVGPLSPNYDLSDLYPIKIDRAHMKPGTVVHSNGHALVVTDIDDDGTIHAVDAHPDNSISYKTIDSATLERSRPDHGFGFFNYRPLKAVGGKRMTAPNGQQALYGAKVVPVSDIELYQKGLWSVEQWFGPETNLPPQSRPDPNAFKRAYTQIRFFDYVRTQLSTSAATPADSAVGKMLQGLCDVFAQRVPDIDAGIEAGLTSSPRPQTLPQDVFNSPVKEWEDFATPGRDSRIRFAISTLPNDIVEKYRAGVRGQLKLTYSGSPIDFQRAVLAKLSQVDQMCRVTYTKSDGTKQAMNLSEMVRRTPLMSFDMSDCAEKRWGASGTEMQTCRDQDPSGSWYIAEQALRNTIGKVDENENAVIRSDRPITLQMLQSRQFVDQPGTAPIALGVSRSKLVDLKSYLESPNFVQDLSR